MKAKPQDFYTEPEHIRRKLAEEYRRQAEKPRLKKAVRAELLRTAEAWERTLRKPSKKIL